MELSETTKLFYSATGPDMVALFAGADGVRVEIDRHPGQCCDSVSAVLPWSEFAGLARDAVVVAEAGPVSRSSDVSAALRRLVVELDTAVKRLPPETGVGCPVREAKFAVGQLLGSLARIGWEVDNLDARGAVADKSRNKEA